jgi:mitogen-activated protein kinase kinase kinase
MVRRIVSTPHHISEDVGRAIMFHIGVATQHPPLPEPGQLSTAGISFLKECLTIDPLLRPSAKELMDYHWMLEFREALLSYEEVEMQTSPPVHVDENFDNASVARQAAIIHEQEIEAIRSVSPTSPGDTPFETMPPLPL